MSEAERLKLSQGGIKTMFKVSDATRFKDLEL